MLTAYVTFALPYKLVSGVISGMGHGLLSPWGTLAFGGGMKVCKMCGVGSPITVALTTQASFPFLLANSPRGQGREIG